MPVPNSHIHKSPQARQQLRTPESTILKAMRPAILAILLALPVLLHSQSVTLTPAIVESGSPELIRIHASHPLAKVEGVRPAHYRTSTITVEPRFVEPGPEDQKLIEAASKAKEAAFAAAANDGAENPLWSGNFQAPVKAAATDSFGTRRTFNGKLSSIHKGTDFRAPTGTPVLAGNSGTVILAQKLFYEGNCVMVDHGLGLISISMHLSRIDVKPGQQVTRGQQLGLSGATGRVTGPHLHWAIRWQGVMLDPVKLLHLNLSSLK